MAQGKKLCDSSMRAKLVGRHLRPDDSKRLMRGVRLLDLNPGEEEEG
jgi:hypothetical protein